MSERQYEIGLSAALEWYPPDGPVTGTPTCTVYGPDGESLATPTVTKDSDSQALTASKGQQAVTVANSTSYVVGRRYWLATAGGGRGYSDRLIDKATGIVTLATPSRADYTGGTLKGYRLSASYTAPSAAKRGCRVVWRYDGRAYSEVVDFVPLPFALALTVPRLEELAGNVGEDLGSSGAWLGVLETAERECWAWLSGHQIRPETIIDRESLTTAWAWRCLALRYMATDNFERYQQQHQALLDSFTSSHPWQSDSSTEVTGGEDERELTPQYAGIG